MRVLHLVKTSDGARWALEQARELAQKGHSIAVVLPSQNGLMVEKWRESGVKVFLARVELPIKSPWELAKRQQALLNIVEEFKPDLIHSHFFSTTVLARRALAKSKIPVAFQVPGPLHLENRFFRHWDIQSARPQDFWIGSSHAIRNLYLKHGVPAYKVGMSYYGNKIQDYRLEGEGLRPWRKDGLDPFVVGSISYFYPPKRYLLQSKGLKGHELAFDALRSMEKEDSSAIAGVFWGKQWGGGAHYENKLKAMLPKNCLMPGALKPFEVSKGWLGLDVCIHLPFSENCGGVLEPLLHGVPVIASAVGGLPEIIQHKKTGLLVDRNQDAIRREILWAKEHMDDMRVFAQRGKKLVETAFDVERTSLEIARIYNSQEALLEHNQFDPGEFIENL